MQLEKRKLSDKQRARARRITDALKAVNIATRAAKHAVQAARVATQVAKDADEAAIDATEEEKDAREYLASAIEEMEESSEQTASVYRKKVCVTAEEARIARNDLESFMNTVAIRKSMTAHMVKSTLA